MVLLVAIMVVSSQSESSISQFHEGAFQVVKTDEAGDAYGNGDDLIVVAVEACPEGVRDDGGRPRLKQRH